MERWVGSVGGVVVEDEHAVLWGGKGIAHGGEKGGWEKGIACGVLWEKAIACGVLWMFPKWLGVLGQSSKECEVLWQEVFVGGFGVCGFAVCGFVQVYALTCLSLFLTPHLTRIHPLDIV
jgi:hypothetical protein